MGECQISPDTSSYFITRCSSTNNSKSLQIVSWWSVIHFWVTFVSLLLLCSSGPCYLWHAHFTSSDVSTWDVKQNLWFTDEDNLWFRQGEAVTATGFGFPSLLFSEGVLLQSAWLHLQIYVLRLICWQPNNQLLHALRLSPFSLLSAGFVSAFPTLYLIPSVYLCFNPKPPFPHILPSLSSYLSLWPNVGLQIKQLGFHLTLKGIDMCCSVSGRTLFPSPMHSHKGDWARQIKCPQLLTHKRGKQTAIIQLFIAIIY